jgi:hypothetical protein
VTSRKVESRIQGARPPLLLVMLVVALGRPAVPLRCQEHERDDSGGDERKGYATDGNTARCFQQNCNSCGYSARGLTCSASHFGISFKIVTRHERYPSIASPSRSPLAFLAVRCSFVHP